MTKICTKFQWGTGTPHRWGRLKLVISETVQHRVTVTTEG